MGQVASLADLFRLSPALRYNLKGDYSHIEGVRFFPRAVVYNETFLEAQKLPSDALVRLSGSGLFDDGGIMIRQFTETSPPGTCFGEEILYQSKTYKSTVLAIENSTLAMFSKKDFELGLEAAIQAEAEKRLSYMMTRVFHDTMPMAISKKITVALLRNEIVVEKFSSLQCHEARLYCVFQGSISLRRPVKSNAERLSKILATKPPQYSGKKQREPISRRVKVREKISRLPPIEKNYFDLPVELRIDKNFKNLMLRKKQNPAGYETVMSLQSSEVFGLYEMINREAFDYQIFAHENSTIISMSADLVSEFALESPYFKRFIRNHFKELIKFRGLAAQEKSRMNIFYENSAERQNQLEKEMIYKDPQNIEYKESVDEARKYLNSLVGHRKPENINIFETHSKEYWEKMEVDHTEMVEDFSRLFQKPDPRLRFRLMKENSVSISPKSRAGNSSVLTANGSSRSKEKFSKLDLSPSVNVSVIDEIEVSFGKSSEYPSVYSQKESTLASRLLVLSRDPGGRNLAKYIAGKVLPPSAKSRDRKDLARSYDHSSKNRKKQIFETVVEKSTSVDQEYSFHIKSMHEAKSSRVLRPFPSRDQLPKFGYEPFKARAKTTKPRIRFELPLN